MPTAEVCAIIEVCAKSNVSVLKYGKLLVEFREASRFGGNQLTSVDQFIGGETPADNGPGDDGLGNKMLLTPEDEELRESLRLAELMTTDPVAYEQEMIDANLSGQDPNDGQDA